MTLDSFDVPVTRLAVNLRLACSCVGSIAEVCRQLNLNRPQFNRYLSGQSRPAAHILRRLGDFFGVDAHEWWLEPAQFARMFSVRPNAAAPTRPTADHDDYRQALRRMAKNSVSPLERYFGAWFEYYPSMSSPGEVLRSFVWMCKTDDERVHYRRIERLVPLGRTATGDRCSYRGRALWLNDRIFLIDYEQLTGNELTQTIYFPSYKSRVGRLAGLKIGVSASGGREPCAVRTVFEYLGQRVDIRRALRQCCLLNVDDPSLDLEVVRRIQKPETANPWGLTGQPY